MTEIYNQKYVEARTGLERLFRKWFIYKKVLKLVEPKNEDFILEIGCERGDLVKMMSIHSQKVIGIDINKEVIDKLSNKNLIYMSGEKLEFPDSSFDKVVSSHTIEHIPHLEKFFSETERVLKPGGKCILVYPLEPFRGWAAMADAWRIFKNPFKAGKLHLHRLWPNKLKKFTRMKMVAKGIFFRPVAIDFYTVFQKE